MTGLAPRSRSDTRVVNSIRNRTDKSIDSPDEVGGWPALTSAPAPVDADRDGMPDEWEGRFGFDPKDASDNTRDRDWDSYTNLEEYLNGTDPRTFGDYANPENNVNTLN